MTNDDAKILRAALISAAAMIRQMNEDMRRSRVILLGIEPEVRSATADWIEETALRHGVTAGRFIGAVLDHAAENAQEAP